MHLGSYPFRKRRTRQHVIAAQSINHVERCLIDEGHVPQRIDADYGYDLTLYTFDEDGFAEPGAALLQVKASDHLTATGEVIPFDLDIRDYSLWILEKTPVFLILFDASTRQAIWLHVQSYFANGENRKPKGRRTVRIFFPTNAVLDGSAVAEIQKIKNQAQGLFGDED